MEEQHLSKSSICYFISTNIHGPSIQTFISLFLPQKVSLHCQFQAMTLSSLLTHIYFTYCKRDELSWSLVFYRDFTWIVVLAFSAPGLTVWTARSGTRRMCGFPRELKARFCTNQQSGTHTWIRPDQFQIFLPWTISPKQLNFILSSLILSFQEQLLFV